MMTLTTLWCYMFFLSVLLVYTSKSPMKMIPLMMVSITSLSAYLYFASNDIWFPTIYFLIFTGGIMILIIMVSSIIPNMKMGKRKKMMFPLISGVLTLLMISYKEKMMMPWSMEMKMSFFSESSMIMVMTIMLMYFVMFTWIMSMESGSLRSQQCCNGLIL